MARKENRQVSPEELNARAGFTAHRDALPCSSCNAVGKYNFTTDGTGKTRFQCSNKAPKCNASISTTGMLNLLQSRGLPVPTVSASNMVRPSPAPSQFFSTFRRSQTETPATPDRELSPPENADDFGEGLQGFNKRGAQDVSFLDEFPPRDAPFHVLEHENETLKRQLSEMKAQQTASTNQITALISTVASLTAEIQSLRRDLAVNNSPSRAPPVPKAASNTPKTSDAVPFNAGLPHPTLPTSSSALNLPAAPTTTNTLVNTAEVPRLSYAEIAARRGLVGENQENAVTALAKLLRRPRNTRPNNQQALTRIYVRGIGRMPVRDLKEALRALRIRTSAICSISFVGASIAEFLVTSDYAQGFTRAITSLSPIAGRISVLSTYNAAAAADPQATEAIQQKCKDAFVRRIHGLIQKNPNLAAQNFYLNWLQSLNLPLPSTTTPNDNPAPAPTVTADAIQVPTPTTPTVDTEMEPIQTTTNQRLTSPAPMDGASVIPQC